MKNIKLRSHVGDDGNLQLNIPTAFSNTELDIFIFLRPATSFDSSQSKTFSERWQGKFKGVPHAENSDVTDRSNNTDSNFK